MAPTKRSAIKNHSAKLTNEPIEKKIINKNTKKQPLYVLGGL